MPHPRTRRAQRKVNKGKKQFSSKLLDSPGRKSKTAMSISKTDAGKAAAAKRARRALRTVGRMSKSATSISLPSPGSLGRKLK